MPRRTDLRHVLVIGSGPIVIGQACEFDYSGTQACRVLRAEGLRVSLVNSNPATIMTDPEFADATYVEPVTPEFVEKVIARERPDALLADAGRPDRAQHRGRPARGRGAREVRRGADRRQHRRDPPGRGSPAVQGHRGRRPAVTVPRSRVCHSMDEVRAAVADLGLPVVIRPSFTMGGLGSGMAHSAEALERLAGAGLAASPVHEVLIEESVLGWKEYELELMRDRHDNVVVVCSIENVDPMGVHTGDSVTVAPAMTLTDREYQAMRDLGIAVLREVGVDTGGCNIQFAVHPQTGRLVVIEMNPRVSRSSALASKATGFPIAKIAAKLAIGYTLDEIPNDITLKTPAAFEPALDYVVVKVPRFAFEKFPGADPELTTTMKSVGEAMSLGRNFTEALNKAMRSMETRESGFWTRPDPVGATVESTLEALRTPHDGRLYTVELALRLGATVAEVGAASGYDPWFVDQIASLVELRAEIVDAAVLDVPLLRRAKRAGLSDLQLAALRPELAGEDGVRALRHRLGMRPVYKTVDTCAAEFGASTPYHYSSYDEETEVDAVGPAQGADPRLGAEPDRSGHRVRLLVRARGAGAAPSATRPSWSTATRRRCRPTTTRRTGSTSSRSRSRTCWRCGTPRTPPGGRPADPASSA